MVVATKVVFISNRLNDTINPVINSAANGCTASSYKPSRALQVQAEPRNYTSMPRTKIK